MASRQKQKGYKLEHWVEQSLKEAGIPAARRAQVNQEDILLIETGEKLECKARKSGLKSIYDWLGDNDYLALKWQSHKARNMPILVIMRWEKFVNIFQRCQQEDH